VSLVFPQLIGITWPVQKRLLNSTIIQTAQSGKEIRLANYGQARYEWELTFGYLPGDPAFGTDLQTLMGFFEGTYGSLTPFLFQDMADYSTVASNFGTGDGTTTTFQLARTMGGFSHLIYAPFTVPAPEIYLNGVLQGSGYTISANGLVTFASAPSASVAITATFQYYFVVRFADDTNEWEQVVEPYWAMKSLVLREVVAGL
jgi:uncharacterized protein (TIGR02217 family)